MLRRLIGYTVASVLALAIAGDARVCTEHAYLGNNPNEGNPGWHVEVQGLAHDSDYWYITQNIANLFGGPRLWRIPVTHDLADDVSCGSGGVSCSFLITTPLFAHDYNHYGDPDYFEFAGRGYILVPIENGDDGPGVAVFRADAALTFLAYAPFPGQTHAGWVAVDANGLLLSSEGESVTQFNRFALDWAQFQAGGEHAFTLAAHPPILLHDFDGSPLELLGAQGGEYSDDGQLLYFSNGFGDLAEASWGVHVFEPQAECIVVGDSCTARRIERSHNGPGGFAYEFNTSNLEEPEGLTFWDLDADGRAPGLRGQLHVVLLDNDILGDDAYVKHYRLSTVDMTAPEVACPLDAVSECTSPQGVAAIDPQLTSFFAGATATDSCDPTPSLTNNAPPFFPRGSTAVTFTATDQALNSASCVAQVKVVDTTDPAIVCPAPAIVECTSPQGIPSGSAALAAFFSAASASDACDAGLDLSHNAPALLPLGSTPVVFTARDDSGNDAACTSTIQVVDKSAPTISVTLSKTRLWPPNHALVPIAARVVVTDQCDAGATFTLMSITSNEPDNGLGDGNTTGDIRDVQLGTSDTAFTLRAERSGTGNGRVYTVTYRATDRAGNTSTATATVSVP